ncbi:MAG: hypothetical protein H6Q90_7016, partial [Deltaproteobacteria bacterium]|nr:hypothetical protein [Deltaproteobacteria bacterium]
WQSYMLDDALGTDIYWDAGGLGVLLQDGKIFFMLTREFSPRTTEWGLFEVTLVPPTPSLGGTMTLTEITPSSLLHPMAFYQKRPNGHIRGVVTFAAEVPVALELDPSTGDISADTPPCTGSACTTDLWISGDGGDSFHGYSQTGPGVAMCRMTWSENAPAKQACIRPHEWFVPSYSHRNHVVVADDDQPYLVWSQDDEAYAIGITDAGALTPVHPLGPGRIENFAISRLGRPRFAGFELVYPLVADEGHLVRMTSHGPEQVNFRETPCAAVGCGYTGGPNFGLSLVNWIQPTGRGDFYVFYVVQSDSTGGNRQALYMSPSETPTFAPIAPSGPLPGPPTYTPPTDAAPMTPIQQACIAIAACVGTGGADQGIAGCVRQLTTTNPFEPYAAAYRARLIAALPGGCAAIRAAQGSEPGTCSKRCTLSGGTCPAGSSTCSNLITLGAQQCNACSDATTYLACETSSTAYAVSCPTGTECSAVHGCVQTAFCDSNNATSCMGTDRTTCEFGTQIVRTEDCAGQGGTCALASCESTQIGAPCNELFYGTQCQGPYITSCVLGKTVYADCRELGHAACVAQPGGGYGHCTE